MSFQNLLSSQWGLRKKVRIALGLKSYSIYTWKQCPTQHVLAVERITGIHRSILRPDLYPPEEYPLGRAAPFPSAPTDGEGNHERAA
jgi:hypothetical protein